MYLDEETLMLIKKGELLTKLLMQNRFEPVSPEEQIVMKMLAAMASIPLDKIQHSDLDDMQWAAVGNAMSEIKDFNLEIIDDSKATPDSVRLDLLRIKREKAGATMTRQQCANVAPSGEQTWRHKQTGEKNW